ncbi:hypothetical protein CWI42_031070 [Ordospora colligata]|uniref:Uncharacterized protein n=1 Tax=Ordospora colligata OC4 TaxID=1354746 RepID=A0A0B2UG83_9MICR|nr:uncharacterized protein M896_030780 [Ordospora colligata OC4]KHN70091.1 hypothetical protein M896_030780 [Ordospora colligata OC4]TBU16473.1 hypothetical protein CWI41_030740 [Ordospora colligata]TBU16658.1 hypothetical protein CWI40_031140 [Ordospora colligata]TBU19231.1 hypothetical protein CWI42_031070 [Ordospora colligata]
MEGNVEQEVQNSIVEKQKKQQQIDKLTHDMKLIACEIQSERYTEKTSYILHEFEKDVRYFHNKKRCVQIPMQSNGVKAVSEYEKMRMFVDYVTEAREVMLKDVLRQSKKVVFTHDWEIGYREQKMMEVAKRLERRRKKGNVVRKFIEEEIQNYSVDRCVVAANMDSSNHNYKINEFMEKVKHELLRHSMKRMNDISDYMYDVCSKSNENDGVLYENVMRPIVVDDEPALVFTMKKNNVVQEFKHVQSKSRMIEIFKKYLDEFSKCNGARSVRTNFQVQQPVGGAHPTHQQLFKKIHADYTKCKCAKDIVTQKYRNCVIDSNKARTSAKSQWNSKERFEQESSEESYMSGPGGNWFEYNFLIEPQMEVPDIGIGHDLFQAEIDHVRTPFVDSQIGCEEDDKKEHATEKLNMESSFDKFLADKATRNKVKSITIDECMAIGTKNKEKKDSEQTATMDGME